jgi:Apea-like HEPN
VPLYALGHRQRIRGMRYTKIVPLENIGPIPGQVLSFAGGFELVPTPAWVLKDSMLGELCGWDRDEVHRSASSLIATYDAEGRGSHADDEQNKFAQLAGVALWLHRAFPAKFRVIVQCPEGSQSIVSLQPFTPVEWGPHDARRYVGPRPLEWAADLHHVLLDVWRAPDVHGAVRLAIDAVLAALMEPTPRIRYMLLWIAVEALMGTNREERLSRLLRSRIAGYLGVSQDDRQQLSDLVDDLYTIRSKLIHGDTFPANLMPFPSAQAHTELLVRRCLRRTLEEPGMLAAFSPPSRDAFLDTLPKTQSTQGIARASARKATKVAQKAAKRAAAAGPTTARPVKSV